MSSIDLTANSGELPANGWQERVAGEQAEKKGKFTEKLGSAAGHGYNAGLVPSTISSGMNLSPFGLVSTLLSVSGNMLLAKHGDKAWAQQAAQGLYMASGASMALAGVTSFSQFFVGSMGSIGTFALGAYDAKRDKDKPTNPVVDKVLKHRAAFAGGLGAASRALMVEKTFNECMERPTGANYAMFAAACIWGAADICYACSTTKDTSQSR